MTAVWQMYCTIGRIPSFVVSFVHFARLESMTRPPAHASSALVWASRVPWLAVWLVAATAPFEKPLIAVGAGLTVTTVEAACLLAVGAALAAFAVSGQTLQWRTPITWASIACVTAFACAALVAPDDRANALKFVGRMLAASAVFLVTLNAVTAREQARAVVRLLLAFGVVVSVVAVLEAAEVRAVLDALTVFRPGFHVVGGQLRATSTLLYPTITSMYLEVVFVLGLVAAARSSRAIANAAHRDRADGSRHRRRGDHGHLHARRLDRHGHRARPRRRAAIREESPQRAKSARRGPDKTRRADQGHLALAILGLVLVTLVLFSRSPDILMARLRTTGSEEWYGATYSAPAALRFQTGGAYQVPVTIVNTGRVIWDSNNDPMFAMSYHWLRADTGAVVEFDGWRTAFPAPVDPQARVTLPVNVTAPGEPGAYVLVWDVVHEHRAWLSTEGVVPARTAVEVEGERVPAITTTSMARLPGASRRADRLTLWRTALQMAGDRPFTGVGPDNFRNTYGRYLGLSSWDTRVHANNMYLEVLAGAGVLGLGAFLWLAAAGGTALWRQWRHASPATSAAAAAFCAAWLMIAGHGLVDSFLSFTSTYVLFALVAGLALSPALREVNDADRV